MNELLLFRIPNPEAPITNHQSPITNHESRITNHESRITNPQSPLQSHLPDPKVKENPQQQRSKHHRAADDDGHDPQRAAGVRVGHPSSPRGVSGGAASSPRAQGSPSGLPATRPASTSMHCRRCVM